MKKHKLKKQLKKLLVKHVKLSSQLDELQATFDLRWKADMRAIKKWQERTGRDMVWPDHADMCVWLMEQNDQLEKKLKVGKR